VNEKKKIVRKSDPIWSATGFIANLCSRKELD